MISSDERQQRNRVESELMDAYIRGDVAAFDKLFRHLGPQVYGFFMRRFGDSTAAEDMLQTTFFKVHRARATYRPGSPVRPWIFAIAANVRLDELRRRQRRPESVDSDRVERVMTADPDGSAAAANPAEDTELKAKVREAIDALPETQKVVILLHRYEELTFDEIANILDSTEGAVKLRAFRAYSRLRAHLTDYLGDTTSVSDRRGPRPAPDNPRRTKRQEVKP